MDNHPTLQAIRYVLGSFLLISAGLGYLRWRRVTESMPRPIKGSPVLSLSLLAAGGLGFFLPGWWPDRVGLIGVVLTAGIAYFMLRKVRRLAKSGHEKS